MDAAALAPELAARLDAPVRVTGPRTLEVGRHDPVSLALDSRAGGTVAVAPLHDAAGTLVSVLTGPVRGPGETEALLSDLAGHFDACRSADLPFHAAARAVAAALAAATGAQVSVERSPDAGFPVDLVRLAGRPDAPEIRVAENGAWVRRDGSDGPAHDHADVGFLVDEFVVAMDDAAPAPR